MILFVETHKPATAEELEQVFCKELVKHELNNTDCRTEGTLPVPESAHAIKVATDLISLNF